MASDWEARLLREGVRDRFADFDLCYHVSLHPAYPDEYHLPGIVGLTFRYPTRRSGRLAFALTLDPAAALRLGERLGLDAASSLAMVDSHERMHIALQLEGVGVEDEERQARFADAAWLSLRHPRAAEALLTNPFGVVTRVGPEFWEALVDPTEDA